MVVVVQRITGVDDIDEIISTYARHEDEMFSMYNYVQARTSIKLPWEIIKLGYFCLLEHEQ